MYACKDGGRNECGVYFGLFAEELIILGILGILGINVRLVRMMR